MPELTFHPPLPAHPSGAFHQQIRLNDGPRLLGTATWHAPDSAHGVVQVLDLTVLPPHARQGHGGRLLGAVIQQAKQICQARGVKLRRVWFGIEQKSQVVARAFLTKHGFHHVATIGNLLKDEDELIYVKAYD